MFENMEHLSIDDVLDLFIAHRRTSSAKSCRLVGTVYSGANEDHLNIAPDV
jgi:hypothetical protein